MVLRLDYGDVTTADYRMYNAAKYKPTEHGV